MGLTMEYEFRRNTLNGTVIATFSMDHEVMGRWFTEELASRANAIDDILAAMQQLRASKINHWRLVGDELSLELDAEQARVYANVIDFEEDYELEEAMSLYDAESQAFCGLEDFEQVLLSWQTFLQQTR